MSALVAGTEPVAKEERRAASFSRIILELSLLLAFFTMGTRKTVGSASRSTGLALAKAAKEAATRIRRRALKTIVD